MKTIKFKDAHMIQQVVDGVKTQTRRAVKVQPHGAGSWVRQGLEWMFPNICPHTTIKCPYGIVGDTLQIEGTDHLIQITSIRVERVQDITPQDAIQEGVPLPWPKDFDPDYVAWPHDFESWPDAKKEGFYEEHARAKYITMCHYADMLIKGFKGLWNSIYAKKHPWSDNCWVWVIKFKVVGGAS